MFVAPEPGQNMFSSLFLNLTRLGPSSLYNLAIKSFLSLSLSNSLSPSRHAGLLFGYVWLDLFAKLHYTYKHTHTNQFRWETPTDSCPVVLYFV